MDDQTRASRFVITFEVEPDPPAYDDPEWAADAAHGALTNELEGSSGRVEFTDFEPAALCLDVQRHDGGVGRRHHRC